MPPPLPTPPPILSPPTDDPARSIPIPIDICICILPTPTLRSARSIGGASPSPSPKGRGILRPISTPSIPSAPTGAGADITRLSEGCDCCGWAASTNGAISPNVPRNEGAGRRVGSAIGLGLVDEDGVRGLLVGALSNRSAAAPERAGKVGGGLRTGELCALTLRLTLRSLSRSSLSFPSFPNSFGIGVGLEVGVDEGPGDVAATTGGGRARASSGPRSTASSGGLTRVCNPGGDPGGVVVCASGVSGEWMCGCVMA